MLFWCMDSAWFWCSFMLPCGCACSMFFGQDFCDLLWQCRLIFSHVWAFLHHSLVVVVYLVLARFCLLPYSAYIRWFCRLQCVIWHVWSHAVIAQWFELWDSSYVDECRLIFCTGSCWACYFGLWLFWIYSHFMPKLWQIFPRSSCVYAHANCCVWLEFSTHCWLDICVALNGCIAFWHALLE